MYYELQKETRFKPFTLLQVSNAIMLTVNVRRSGWIWGETLQSQTPSELHLGNDIWWHRHNTNGSGTIPDALLNCHWDNQVAFLDFVKSFPLFSPCKLRLYTGFHPAICWITCFCRWVFPELTPCSVLLVWASDQGVCADCKLATGT